MGERRVRWGSDPDFTADRQDDGSWQVTRHERGERDWYADLPDDDALVLLLISQERTFGFPLGHRTGTVPVERLVGSATPGVERWERHRRLPYLLTWTRTVVAAPSRPVGVRRLAVRATHVVVVRGEGFDAGRRKRNDVVADVNDATAHQDLADALAVGSLHERAAWMETGVVTLAFLADRELVGTVTVLGGAAWVRSELWEWDAPVVDPPRLTAWLDEHAPGWDPAGHEGRR